MADGAGEVTNSVDEKHYYFPTFAFVAGLLIGLIGGASACALVMMGSKVLKVTLQTVHATTGAPDQYLMNGSLGKRTTGELSATKYAVVGPNLLFEKGENASFTLQKINDQFGFLSPYIPGRTIEMEASGDIDSTTTPLTITASF